MPLLGSAAMLLSFDIEPEAIGEHDRWHTHEHFPERLGIPGFLRGTRWIAHGPGPRYMVIYEVDGLPTLASPAYLARLNDPTPWTRRMMPHYRGMTRGLCRVVGSVGFGQGGFAALLRYGLVDAQAGGPTRWLLDEALAAVPAMPGLTSAHLLQGAQPAAMTNEQRIRGQDRSIDWALIITGYDSDAVDACAQVMMGTDGLALRGATDLSSARYRCCHSLAHTEVAAQQISH